MIRTKLMTHQNAIVDFGLNKPYVGIFGDYGIGKTLAILALMEARNFHRVLVVSTKTSIQTSWPDELRDHTDHRYVLLLGTAGAKRHLLARALRISMQQRMIFLLNMDGVDNVFFDLVRAKFDAIIVDESTKIKTYDSLRTLAITKLGYEIPHRYAMTGFPITENLAEIYAQIKFLDHGKALGTSYGAFLNKYFVKLGPKSLPKKSSIKEIMRAIAPFCIRITNESLKLPPVVYKTVALTPSDQQRYLIDTFEESFQLELGKVKIDTQYIFALITKTLQICDGFITDDKGNCEIVDTPKDEALLDVLEQINPHANKVVIWAAFKFSIAKITRICKRLGYNTISLTGDVTDSNTVNAIRHSFQTGRTEILVATQRKAAESITLSASKYGIYYSNIWSNDARGNSEARIRRKGSEIHSSITYTDIFLKGTREKLVYESLRTKKNLVTMLKEEFRNMGTTRRA